MAEHDRNMLAPPAVAHLRTHDSHMERTLSTDIREEREDLREAAEQTLNVIMDLSFDGTVRWVSPSWKDVIGTPPESVIGKPVADLLFDDSKTVFSDVVESMKKDDSHSQVIHFSTTLGPASKLLPVEGIPLQDGDAVRPADDSGYPTLELEAQGIMVWDKSSGDESHVSLTRLSFGTEVESLISNTRPCG